jgi:hypothetical protein
MGRKYREQANFFYEFRLDDMIPKGHLTPWLTRQSTANRSPRADSLLTGNLTGNFSNLGLFLRFLLLINEQIQMLASKFPSKWNREFF